MNNWIIGLIAISATVVLYILAKKLYNRVYTPFLLPVIVVTVVLVTFLMLANISYETYMVGGKWINELLGAAVVALAYPLYQNRAILKEMALPIIAGTFTGAVIGMVTGVYLLILAQFDQEMIHTILPKSVTTPVAVDISEAVGGIASLTGVFVMIAGIVGAIVSKYVYKCFRLLSPVGRGVGLGSASHAIGTAKALETSQLEGAISTVAMILSAVFVSILTPIFLLLL